MTLARNILTTLTARVAALGLALLSSIVLARALGPEGRGIFSLVLLLPEFVRTFALLGFDQANAVYAGLEPERRRVLVWHSAALAGGLGGLITIAAMIWITVGAPGFEALVQGPVWFYLLSLSILPGLMFVDYSWAILRGMNRIALLNIVEVGTKAASLMLVVVFVGWMDLGVAGAVWANVTIGIAGTGLIVALLSSIGVFGSPLFDRTLWKRTGKFAMPAHCVNVLQYLNYRIDQFMIAALLSPVQLGFYVIAVDLAERLWILTGAVANALLPHLTNSPDRDPAISAVVARHVLVWTGAACLLVFALASVIIEFLYSAEYAEVVSPLRWLLPGILILTAGRVVIGELLAREKVCFAAGLSSIAVVANVAGNLLLIPHMGISGAALASSISYSVVALGVIWYYLRETGLPWRVLMPRRNDLYAYLPLWHRLMQASLDKPAKSEVVQP